MAKKEDKTQDKNKKQEGDKNEGGQRQKGGEENKSEKKGEKKEKKDYKPGLSYQYDPCPHRVWTPKPGERDKSEPRGVGSPWYEPVKKKEDADKEEAEKNKKKEDKSKKKRQQGCDERKKKKEEEDKKNKEEEKKKKEEDSKKEEETKKKKEEKKKKRDEKMKQKQEQRKKEKEKKKEEEDKKKGEGDGKEEDDSYLLPSYVYEPCPHRVYCPAPGEKDLAEPRGVGSPWYKKIQKKCDVDTEQEEKQRKEDKKRKEKMKKRRQAKERREAEKRKKEEEEEEEMKRLKEEQKKEIKMQMKKIAEESEAPREMGGGARKSGTDITKELVCIMDWMSEVDDKVRERRGQQLRWRKKEIDDEINADAERRAYISDFKGIVRTFVEAEWMKADKELKRLQAEQKRKRKDALKSFKKLDPFANDLLAEGQRFLALYDGAMGVTPRQRRKASGDGEEGPSALEDMVVNMMMKQMDTLNSFPVDPEDMLL